MVLELANTYERFNNPDLSIDLGPLHQSMQKQTQKPEQVKTGEAPEPTREVPSLSEQAWELMEAIQWRFRSWTDHTKAKLSSADRFTSLRSADIHAENEFPKLEDANYRFLARKWTLHVFEGGPALTEAESATLIARRKEAYVADAKEKFPDDQDVAMRELYVKYAMAADNKGPNISEQERELMARKIDEYYQLERFSRKAQEAFPEPQDQRYRDLKRREILGQKLLDSESAELKSKTAFPDPRDDKYRLLLRQELLNKVGLGPALTSQEQVILDAKRAFSAADLASQYHARPGHHPEMSAEALSSWLSLREFPSDKYLKYRNLSQRDNLAKYGEGKPLGAAAATELCAKRGNCDMSGQSLAENLKELKLATDAVKRRELGSLKSLEGLLAAIPENRVHSLLHSFKGSGIPVEIEYQPRAHLQIVDQEFKLKQRKEELLKDVPGLSEELDGLVKTIPELKLGKSDYAHKNDLWDTFIRIKTAAGYQGVEALVALFNDKLKGTGYSTQPEYRSDGDPKRDEPQYKPSIDAGDRLVRMQLWREYKGTEWISHPGTKGIKVDELSLPYQGW